MIVYCHDCEHFFVEHLPETEADEMVCPFCEGANYDAMPDEADIMEGK